MIISFYDREFKPLQNNASLVIDKDSYMLIKRPIELNTFTCVCEAFTENIQPTFLVVKDDIGKNVLYSSLAGIPILNKQNKTEITATDLKSIFSSDVIMQYSTYANVGGILTYLFNVWNTQVNKNSFNCEVVYLDGADEVKTDELHLQPSTDKAVYNVLDELQAYLKSYDLYIDSEVDLVGKKLIFYIGKTMQREVNIKLWEYGIRNYGKWIASVNETQGYSETWQEGIKWILTSQNQITIDENNRDIYPIKKKVIVAKTIDEANKEALIALLDARYNEDLEISSTTLNVDFRSKFNIYIKRGDLQPYKSLPCGELRYNHDSYSHDKERKLVSKPYRIQIGYRYTGVDFI